MIWWVLAGEAILNQRCCTVSINSTAADSLVCVPMLCPCCVLQALANNLLSRAVSLSRHAAIGPDAMLCCAVGIAELQLSQAHAMLDSGGTMSSLAAALLSSSYQQLCSKSLADAAASGSPHATGLLDAKKQASAGLAPCVACSRPRMRLGRLLGTHLGAMCKHAGFHTSRLLCHANPAGAHAAVPGAPGQRGLPGCQQGTG